MLQVSSPFRKNDVATDQQAAESPGGTKVLYKEPRTGLKLALYREFLKGPAETPSAVTLKLLGMGPRLYKTLGLKFNVYAVGLYVEEALAREALKDFAGRSPQELSADPSFYQALLAPGPMTRAIHLFFARSVDTSSILDSFRPYPALGPLIDNFRESFDRYIGAKGLPKGSLMSFVWSPEGWTNIYNGTIINFIADQNTARTIFEVYLGEKPASPEAKAGFAANIAQILG